LNNTDLWTEIDGERYSIKTKHPPMTDPAVRNALNLLVDRASIQQHIFGRTAIATATSSTGLNGSSPRTPATSSASTRQSVCWTRRVGGLVLTGYEKGTA